MHRIYKALGIASAQDVRDLQASVASLHKQATENGEKTLDFDALVNAVLLAAQATPDSTQTVSHWYRNRRPRT